MKSIEKAKNTGIRLFNLDEPVNVNNLCPRGDFRVIRIYGLEKHPRTQELTPFLKKVLIDYKGMLLTEKYVEMIYIRKYLKLFASKHLISDEPNDFFELNIEKGQPQRLCCKFDPKRFIYRAEADTILEGLNTALDGYSKKYFDESTNSLEALAYVDSVQHNSVQKPKVKSKEFVQDAMQAFCIKEARQPD
ncbi:hypothetical protein Sulku_1700 [Sulfuricurvum kujiense DSM 16994]|uniref:Uncharacterized protein n=1 Tax=Sulfuricurvum kujiense (strain ATCC BAA-921 / DSM 16994 / JCM 11577 / YK-1) TaxID=709032 RepID=E4U0V9_SULKY|nr:hypothetical protein [Sulfuricurvum kujiense]ADR34361.1 hypothetical protein Sulku_1700 [Sulfuricurvum kujiense DSM 16994]